MPLHPPSRPHGRRGVTRRSRPPRSLQGLSDPELVSLLLAGTATDAAALERARSSLAWLGGLGALTDRAALGHGQREPCGQAPASSLVQDSLRLQAARELGRRLLVAEAPTRPLLSTPAAVARYLAPRLGGLEHEEMWVLSLDGRSRLRSMRCVARGGAHGCGVTARDILRFVLLDGGQGFVLAHNHPSGHKEPSSEDVAMTRALARAAEIVGTPLLDHVVVVSLSEWASLLDEGVL